MAKLGVHKKGHGKEKLLGQSVAHKKARDLHTGDQMQPHPMTSEVHPDISSLAGPDMSGQASTQGSPYMGGMSVGMKKGGSVSKMKKAIESHEEDDTSQDRALIKKAFRMHDQQEHKGERTNLSKLKKGGSAKPGLWANINRRKKLGISRPKSKSTISAKAYANMKAGFPKKKS